MPANDLPIFNLQSRGSSFVSPRPNTLSLREDNWDDFGFKTTFHLSYHDAKGDPHEIGDVKIGYVAQAIGTTASALPPVFQELGSTFFSLGQSPEYYSTIVQLFGEDVGKDVLHSLRDVVAWQEYLDIAKDSRVFDNSLTRSVSMSSIENQFRRIISGGAILTDFDFGYFRAETERLTPIELTFKIEPESTPPSNIHVLIGRNGVGKTTVLNHMAVAIASGAPGAAAGGFFTNQFLTPRAWIPDGYFSGVTSVSFSAFDPFDPIQAPSNTAERVRHTYVGLKKSSPFSAASGQSKPQLKNDDELRADIVASLSVCFSLRKRRRQWLRSVEILESDPNFEEMGLGRLASDSDERLDHGQATLAFKPLSSGHAIVLLTLTRLIETIEEKSLVLIDEPESHLHPPLLAAFTRALSELLTAFNAIAIVATHSPVVLQEVPRNCTWKLYRSRLAFTAVRPEFETFGENVGILTREVFGLEVSKSGFHDLLASAVAEGGTFERIVARFSGQIGFEGQAVLRAMINARDAASLSE